MADNQRGRGMRMVVRNEKQEWKKVISRTPPVSLNTDKVSNMHKLFVRRTKLHKPVWK